MTVTTQDHPAAPSTPGGERPTLLLLDGHSLAYRAFYALPVENFSTTTGQPTNAVYGFTSMLINLLRDERPSHVAVAFDLSRHTWRSEEFAAYKANRSASPEDFRGQVELIREVLTALRIPALQAENFEADDVIATLTVQAAAQGMAVRICTGDRDALQLVTDQVTVLYPKRGVSELTRFTPEEVEAKYGLTPQQYPDFAALRGDPSDNLPGIPGVGEKTAAKWIREYGSLTGLVDRVDQIGGKTGDALRDNLSNVLQNRRLTELVKDVALDSDPAVDLIAQPYDREAVHSIFDNLQFRVLRERLLEIFEQEDETTVEGGFDVQGGKLATGAARVWLDEHGTAGRVGIVARGTFGAGAGDVHTLAFAAPDGTAAVIDLATLDEDDDAAISAFLADPRRPKVGHDLKPAINALLARGWAVDGIACDTALAAYLALPGQRSFDLGDLVQRYLHRTLQAGDGDGSGQLLLTAELEDDSSHLGLMVEARAVLDLAEVLATQLSAGGQLELLNDIELPVMTVLGQMERTGIAVDVERLDALHATFTEEANTAAQLAYAEIGKEVNLGSPKQLQVILFDELDMPKTKKTKTGYTTDADALAELYVKTEHPFLQALLRHRDVTKLRTTIEGLQKSVREHAGESRIHTTYLQNIAATGRLSSTEPNLQNIPVRTEEGRQIRTVFVPGARFTSLMTADYSQIEMRIMAHLSKDAGLIEAFRSGEDLHTFVASRALGVPVEEVTGEMRRRIKAMTYGLAYGLSAFGLSGQLKIGVDEAKEQMEAYFSRFGGVRDYLRGSVDRARADGYTETLFGRRRYLPDLTSDIRQRRELAERVALNSPIQGSAADIIKVAMIRVQRRLENENLASRLLLQVHDELVCEVADGEQDAVTAIVREEMEGAYALDVSMDVSVGIGVNWDSAAPGMVTALNRRTDRGREARVLIPKRVAEAIRAGTVTLAFRRWDAPRVKVGSTQLTSAGIVGVDAVDEVRDLAKITRKDARAAGFADPAALAKRLAPSDPRTPTRAPSPRGSKGGERVYRIRMHWVGEDPRVALRDAVPDDAELVRVAAAVAKLDAGRKTGPWTRPMLEWIRDHPAIVSKELANLLDRELLPMKADVRRLKALGLTISLEVGYRLSPRGAAYLEHL